MHMDSPGMTIPLNGLNRFVSILKKATARITNVWERLSTFLRKEVWRLEGIDEDSQNRRAVLFTGNSPERHYIAKLFFNDDCAHQYLGLHWLWQILFPSLRMANNASFNVIQTSWPLGRFPGFKKMFCLPTWVFGSVDLTSDFEAYARENKGVKNTLRKVKNSNFKVVVSSDPLLFDEFYYRMHQPYMYRRHGESAVEESYERLKARFNNNSEILFVANGSLRIAGIMLCYQKDGVLAYRLGVRDGDFRWVEQGAISALYVNAMHHCRTKGIKKLNLGGSRPFLSDGVLTYKLRNWNMKIDDYSKHFYFLLKPIAQNPFTRDFLHNNSFISLNKGKMVVNAFVDRCPEKMTAAQKMKTTYAKKGLRTVNLHYH